MSNGMRVLPAIMIAAALAAPAEAQRGAAGSDVVSLNVYGGGFSPTGDLTASGGFRDSGSVGGALTLWLHRNVGVRGNVLYARTEVGGGSPEAIVGEKPDVWAYSGDLVLRLPFHAPGQTSSWFPYAVGGLGGKSYRFDASTETDFAGNFGAGLEYRFGPWGVQGEVRNIVTSFERYGVNDTQHDVVWTAGITRSF